MVKGIKTRHALESVLGNLKVELTLRNASESVGNKETGCKFDLHTKASKKSVIKTKIKLYKDFRKGLPRELRGEDLTFDQYRDIKREYYELVVNLIWELIKKYRISIPYVY